MSRLAWLLSAAAVGSLLAVLVMATSALAASPNAGDQSADQNVRASRQYEQLLCSNPAFRAKRIAQECGPIDDPDMHQSCVASFQCGASPKGSQQSPPSETIR